MNQRCKTFMQKFDALGIDAALVSSYENVRYLSGFTNTETLLVLDAKEQWLLTDSRYSEQAEKQCPDFTVIKTGHGVSLATELKKRINGKNVIWEISRIDISVNMIVEDHKLINSLVAAFKVYNTTGWPEENNEAVSVICDLGKEDEV